MQLTLNLGKNKMLIYETTKKGTNIQLRQGQNGSGNAVFSVQTNRTGSKGQDIVWGENFNDINEAKNWIKWSI